MLEIKLDGKQLCGKKPLEIEVLGTPYKVTYKPESEIQEKLGVKNVYTWGYCDNTTHDIVISDMADANFTSDESRTAVTAETIRHELVHAFLSESGLKEMSWAVNEEIVDWIAAQLPKMAKLMKAVGVL